MSEPMITKTAAAYIRVSTDRQEEYSPESQLKIIREYAGRDGYRIPEEYVFRDDGISGKSASQRGEFVRMIAIAKGKAHPFEVIYVWKFSRFARNQEEALVYKNLLRRRGVAVVSVSEPLPDGPWGTLIERIIEWMDEYYLINLGAEVRRGMNERAARGLPNVPPAVGYDIIDGKYVPNRDADIVREVFRRFNSGEGMRQIAAELGAAGVRTKFGNPPDNRWVEYILNNPCYIGKIRWSADGKSHVSKRDYDNPGIMTVDGQHEPIITPKEWEMARARCAELKRIYGHSSRPERAVGFALKGLLRCSACGSTLTVCSGGERLQCHNYARGVCCKSHSVSVTAAMSTILEALCAALGELSFTVAISEMNKKAEDASEACNKAMSAERRRLLRAKEAYLFGIDTLEEYRKNKDEAEKRLQMLEKKRQRQGASSYALKNEALRYTHASVRAMDILRAACASDEAKNLILRCMLEKIVFQRAENRYILFFRT